LKIRASPFSLLSHLLAIWINIWTAANQKNPNQKLGFYLGIYALLVILSNAGTAGECWSVVSLFPE
jgi:ATP-binding cassette subfamily C (CFTR/MRP) protein 1